MEPDKAFIKEGTAEIIREENIVITPELREYLTKIRLLEGIPLIVSRKTLGKTLLLYKVKINIDQPEMPFYIMVDNRFIQMT